jgi:hypothetical protein
MLRDGEATSLNLLENGTQDPRDKGKSKAGSFQFSCPAMLMLRCWLRFPQTYSTRERDQLARIDAMSIHAGSVPA